MTDVVRLIVAFEAVALFFFLALFIRHTERIKWMKNPKYWPPIACAAVASGVILVAIIMHEFYSIDSPPDPSTFVVMVGLGLGNHACWRGWTTIPHQHPDRHPGRRRDDLRV